MTNKKIEFGNLSHFFDREKQNNIMICLTENCNLRCKYCYMKSKNNKSRLDLKTAYKAIDCILNSTDIYNSEAVVWSFIGGEPFLEIDLLDKISDYIKENMIKKTHPWAHNYKFAFTTNGILYNDGKVQDYIKKNKSHLLIEFSIDGNKQKHDLQRIYEDGRGSYYDVIKNVPLWISQFSEAYTKVTFSHQDLPYLKDSIIHLWDLGIKRIAANSVFENVWDDDDPLIFEKQLYELADYILENNIWEKDGYNLNLFNPEKGLPLYEKLKDKCYCDAGIKTIAIDCYGRFVPCIRFFEFALTNKKPIFLGNIDVGVLKEKIAPFRFVTRRNIDPIQCKKCNIASGCDSCAAVNYDDIENETIFNRVVYNCKMHKANVNAIEYFWKKIENKLNGEKSPRQIAKEKFMVSV